MDLQFLVADPGPKLGFGKVLQTLLPSQLFKEASPPVDLAHKIQSDPLMVLPYDVLHGIIAYLSIEDGISLMEASWHVFTSTRDNNFWKHMLRIHMFPWFGELKDFLNTTTFPSSFDFKGLFLWLDDATTPEYAMRGPLIGIVNRRRIWKICQQLVPQYLRKIVSKNYIEPDDKEAQPILDSAVSLHTPMVYYPPPRAAETVSTQFIRSWKEITSRDCTLTTYWNANDLLIGISVDFGPRLRVFGSTAGHALESLFIHADEWIKEIVVWTNKIDMFNEHQDRSQWQTPMDACPFSDTGIKGLGVSGSACSQLIYRRASL